MFDAKNNFTKRKECFIMAMQDCYHLTKEQLAFISYSFFTIVSELSKLLLLLVIFSHFNRLSEFLFSSFLLLGIRCFAGGIHFQHYIACFLFSGFFFGSSILLSEMLPLSIPLRIVCLLFCLFVTAFFAPVTSPSRPEPTLKHRVQFRNRALFFTGLSALFLLFLPKNLYANLGIWTIVLQNIQLFIAKGKEHFYGRKKPTEEFY